MAPKIIEQSTQLLQAVSKGRLLALIAIVVVATIGFGTLIFWNTRPDFQVDAVQAGCGRFFHTHGTR